MNAVERMIKDATALETISQLVDVADHNMDDEHRDRQILLEGLIRDIRKALEARR